MNRLRQKFLQTVAGHSLIHAGDRVLCGVSGGADSMALLHLLMTSDLGADIVVFHVNHRLRGAESDADEAFVREFCAKQNLVFSSRTVEIQRKGSLEASARDARYRAFFEAADEFSCNRIATAHNANDNAETVLFHLTRGSGLTGLLGIPISRGSVIRPLLGCTREEIQDYLHKNKIEYRFDSSNDSLAFSRNRIRANVLPELEQVHPSAVKSINRSVDLLRADAEFFLQETQRWMQKATFVCGEWRYPISVLIDLHPALRSRVILQLVRNTVDDPNFHLEFQHICDIMNLLSARSPSAELDLPSGLQVRRAYDEVVFLIKKTSETRRYVLEDGVHYRFGRFEICCHQEKPVNVHRNFTLYEVNSAIITNRFILRGRQIGDHIKLPGRCQKTLKKMMIDEKIEKHLRDEIPVISDGERIVLVHGLGVDERYLPSSECQKKYIEIGLCEA